jgi:hypothetical protein
MSKPVQYVFYREMYGARESNGLVNGNEYHAQFHGARTVDWSTPGLRVTRLRLLSDPGYPAWDVSYCHGEIGDEKVHVELPFSQLPKRRYLAAIVTHAKRDGVNAKRMGVFDAISTLI